MEVVLPGDIVDGVSVSHDQMGPGIFVDGDIVRVHTPGYLRRAEKRTWVNYSCKRYIPCLNERVLGVVIKGGKQSKVDIGAAVSAYLPELEFEGATKRNKTNLEVGDVVYARLTKAHRHAEPELSCIAEDGKANGLGVLNRDGASHLIRCSTGLCRRLLTPSCHVIAELKKYYSCEFVVALNGRVWVDSKSVRDTIAITNALQCSEYMSNEEITGMVRKVAEM